MRESKFTKALETLDAWELRHLSDFVHSPFFNKHERVTALFDRLISLAPHYPADLLQRQVLHHELFPQEPFDEQKFKDLLSLSMKLLRQFMAYYRIRQNTYTTGMAMLEELRERNWDAEFLKGHERMGEELQKREEKLQERYLKRLQLQELWITFQGISASRRADDSIQVASDMLDAYYILCKLKYGVEMANRQNVVAQEFDTGPLPLLLDYLQAQPALLEQYPAIEMYFLIYRCLTQPDQSETFERLRDRMRDHLPTFPLQEKREIYGYAINFCIRQVNKGNKPYLHTLLELYQAALEDGALFSEGSLSQWDYKNIVSAGLKVGNYEWSENFIEQYKSRVEPASRENAYTYNLASLYFEQGDYKRALRLLQHVEFSDVFYHLGAKVMLLKSFYELNDHEALMSICDSFKIYLKRNKTLSKAHYTVNFNLVGFTRRLAELRRKAPLIPSPDLKTKLQTLQSEITQAGAVAQLPWLMSKLNLLSQDLSSGLTSSSGSQP